MTEASIAVIRDVSGYPDCPPYHPGKQYPECPITEGRGERNPVYESVRRALYLLGYDRERFDQQSWNPLGWLIKPDETVFIKPKMIAHKHSSNDDWDYVITHGSVLRALVDYI
jgi:uncharacterized protein (DUF362 family)